MAGRVRLEIGLTGECILDSCGVGGHNGWRTVHTSRGSLPLAAPSPSELGGGSINPKLAVVMQEPSQPARRSSD